MLSAAVLVVCKRVSVWRQRLPQGLIAGHRLARQAEAVSLTHNQWMPLCSPPPYYSASLRKLAIMPYMLVMIWCTALKNSDSSQKILTWPWTAALRTKPFLCLCSFFSWQIWAALNTVGFMHIPELLFEGRHRNNISINPSVEFRCKYLWSLRPEILVRVTMYLFLSVLCTSKQLMVYVWGVYFTWRWEFGGSVGCQCELLVMQNEVGSAILKSVISAKPVLEYKLKGAGAAEVCLFTSDAGCSVLVCCWILKILSLPCVLWSWIIKGAKAGNESRHKTLLWSQPQFLFLPLWLPFGETPT